MKPRKMNGMLLLAILSAMLLAVSLTTACNHTKTSPRPDPGDTSYAEDTANSTGQYFDVIVVGGEPEGIAAAVSAARNGLSVLLTEDGNALGGLMTLGRLNFLDMNYGPDKELLTRGIFEEFYKELGNAFDIEKAKDYFLALVRKESIALKLGTQYLAPVMEEKSIVGVKVKETKTGEIREYYAQRLIDATVDADVAASAGVPYTVGTEDYGLPDRTMGVTLVFRVKGINWPAVFLYNNWQRVISKIKPEWGDPYAGATWRVAWGYGKQALEYVAQDEMMRFRGPNLARQDDGTVLVNALLIFGVNGLDAASRKEGIERGKKELPHIMKFMRERFFGFKKAELVDTAEELYVRETRHIEGEYRLTIDDVLENKDQWDKIAHGSYPVDIQPAAPDDLGNVVGKPSVYSIPFRSLVPLKVDNLLVVGRSASYDSLAHGSARVIPVGMCTGQAAGVAAAYSIEKDMGFREMSRSRETVVSVQQRLTEQGAYLAEYPSLRPAVTDHWAYPGMKTLRRLGLAAGGYANNYRLDDPANYWDANYLLAEVIERARNLGGPAAVSLRAVQFPEGLTREGLLEGLAEALSGEKMSGEEALALLRDRGILSAETEGHLGEMRSPPTFGELYMLLAKVCEAAMSE